MWQRAAEHHICLIIEESYFIFRQNLDKTGRNMKNGQNGVPFDVKKISGTDTAEAGVSREKRDRSSPFILWHRKQLL
jgi:putative SOS response-associated peptidase YedK